MTVAGKGGPPKKITKALGDELSIKLACMYKNGESNEEVVRKLGICKESFYKLVKLSPKFANSKKKGEALSQAWWNKLGREGSNGKRDINAAVWIFNMKNRFGWRDKVDVEAKVGGDKKNPLKWEFEIVSKKD